MPGSREEENPPISERMRDFSKALFRFSLAMPLLGVQQVVNLLRDPDQSLNKAAAALDALSESAERQPAVPAGSGFGNEPSWSQPSAAETSNTVDSTSDIPAVVFRYVRAPDKLEAGNFNIYGHKISDPLVGNLSAPSPVAVVVDLSPPAPIYHLWGIFSDPLKPGQQGVMVFLNLSGDLPVAGAFTEWDPIENVPVLADDSLLTRISTQRAKGMARIVGRNDSKREVRVAAGVVVGSLATITGA